MTLQQAIEHLEQGKVHRAKEAQLRREREAAERAAAELAEGAARRAFVSKWLQQMVERLDTEIEYQARQGKPSASANLGWADPYLADMPLDHENALMEELSTHYEAAGFVVRLTKPTEEDWGSIHVSGWPTCEFSHFRYCTIAQGWDILGLADLGNRPMIVQSHSQSP